MFICKSIEIVSAISTPYKHETKLSLPDHGLHTSSPESEVTPKSKFKIPCSFDVVPCWTETVAESKLLEVKNTIEPKTNMVKTENAIPFLLKLNSQF